MTFLVIMRRGWPVLTALLLILIFPGCSSDNSAGPKPDPQPSMSLIERAGLMELTVRNTGGAMPESCCFVAAFQDGQKDTIPVCLSAGDSMTCLLTNIHGGVTVTNDEWDLEATAGDCLSNYCLALVASVNLADYVPSPIGAATVVLCNYTIYLDNFARQNVTFEKIATDEGLILRYVFHNITGDIRAPAPGALCPDITGNMSITSVTVDAHVDIGEGDNPEITLGTCDASVSGLNINVDGIFGWVIELIQSAVTDDILNSIEDGIATQVSSQVGEDLRSLVIVKSSCAE